MLENPRSNTLQLSGQDVFALRIAVLARKEEIEKLLGSTVQMHQDISGYLQESLNRCKSLLTRLEAM